MLEQSFSVPIAADKEGFIDRECPSGDCLFVFKVHTDDWNLFRDEEVFCPHCRHSSPAKNWHPQAQIRHAEEEANNYMERELQGGATGSELTIDT